MASNSKHTEWILETIDHLRRRKARPDLERICHVVRRRFGLSASETEAKLEKLVDAEIVIKVDYKGSTSYRNAAKWRKSMLGCAVLNSTTVSIKIIEAILETSRKRVKELHADQMGSRSNNTEDQFPEYESEVQKYATETGITLDNIGEWLRTNCEGFDNLKSPLTIVLKREIDAGRVKRLLNCNYVITSAQMDEIGDSIKPLKSTRKTDSKTGASPSDMQNGSSAASTNEESSSSSSATGASGELKPKPSPSHTDQRVTPPATAPSTSAPQPARRGRPPKHRPPVAPVSQPTSTPVTRAPASAMPAAAAATPSSISGVHSQSKLKRILTSEPASHIHVAPQPKVARKDSRKGPAAGEPVCDFCELSSSSNPKGEPENLLHCKDCTAKAHPSCMHYPRLLATRASRGPWQCMECKTCCVCLDAGDPDQMLFCDGCDKGYHMSCHQPSIHKKPSGMWECSECRLENMALQRNEFMASVGNRHAVSHESAPPTPAESPVPGSSVMNGDINIPTAPECLGNGKYPDASGWSVNDVVDYLTSAGFSEEAKVFREQEIDGVALLLLKRADVLKGLDLKLGPALKVNRHIQGLQAARQHLT